MSILQQKSQTKFQMQKIIYSSLLFFSILSNAQVGINTETPETTLEVVGKPDEINHYDGILLPKITGDQLSKKFYSNAKTGTIVYVTSPATNLTGQVVHVVESGYYFFNGNYWVQFLKEPNYYDALIVLDETLPANSVTTNTNWNSTLPFSSNPRQHTYSYRVYRLGTAGLGISGQIDVRRIGTVGFLDLNITCTSPFVPTNSNYTLLNIQKPLKDLGFMTDASANSFGNINVTGQSFINSSQIDFGVILLSLSSFNLFFWKNQIEKFSGSIKGTFTYPINYLNVIN